MKKTINFYDFEQAFAAAGRAEQFSREALKAIFEMMLSIEDDCGEELELDVIAICCDWSEDSVEEIAENYGIDITGYVSSEEKSEAVLDYLQDNTTAVQLFNGGIVYVSF